MTGEQGGTGGLPPRDHINQQASGGGDTSSAGDARPVGAAGQSSPIGAAGLPGISGGPQPSQPRPPVLRYIPGTRGEGEETTQELPLGYASPEMFGQPARPPKPARPPRSRAPLIAISSVLALVAIIAAAIFTPLRDLFKDSSVPIIGGCADGTPCQVTKAYLTAYTGGDYEAMYNLTSAASRARFGKSEILVVSPTFRYQDAHDYIVRRTQTMLGPDFAAVSSIQATVGDVKRKGDVEATVLVHMTMLSGKVGPIAQDIAIPLVSERGKWLVDWSPGLVFKQLDDPSDPNFRRKLTFSPAAPAARGAILDRDGNALAKDDAVYDICVIPSKITNEANLLKALATNLNMTTDQVKAAYQSGGQDCPDGNGGKRVRTISKGYYDTISGALGSLIGVRAPTRMARVYPYGTDLAAVTGYARLANADCLKAVTAQGGDTSAYTPNDYAGCGGVELWGEKYLHPTAGGTLQIVERNADGTDGKPFATIATRQAAPGADIHTTIALKDQQTAYAMLKLYQSFGGAAFAIEPSSGKVLVMASYPACDPNDFSLAFDTGIQTCINASDGRQVNRALRSEQPIGSAFKVVTLSAALEHNIVTPTETLPCKGSYLVTGESTPRTDTDPIKPATATAPGALGPSCDVTYWLLADRLNHSNTAFLPDMAKGFGYGTATGLIGVPDNEERPGLVPDSQWIKANKNANWSPTDAANLGIGQGFFLATPAQVASVAATIANNGVRMQPRLVTTVTTADGMPIAGFEAKPMGNLPISSQNLTILQNALLGPTSPGGTAYSSFHNFSMPVAGKTGTAETPNPRPHSWFMSYAPGPSSSSQNTPQIATSALVEHSTYGEYCAVPMTLQLLRAHFNQSGDPDPTLLDYCKRHAPFA